MKLLMKEEKARVLFFLFNSTYIKLLSKKKKRISKFLLASSDKNLRRTSGVVFELGSG